MAERPVPLDKKVRVKEGMTRDLVEKVKNEGIERPGRGRMHLYSGAVQEIANRPVGVSQEAYEQSQGEIQGREMYERHLADARAVREQFAEYLEEVPEDETY